jgi:hypothetical protein
MTIAERIIPGMKTIITQWWLWEHVELLLGVLWCRVSGVMMDEIVAEMIQFLRATWRVRGWQNVAAHTEMRDWHWMQNEWTIALRSARSFSCRLQTASGKDS